MKILIVGLGLMGGSYAMGLSKKGHEIYGIDNNQAALDYAKNKGWIQHASLDVIQFITEVDLIILAIYPQSILSFLMKYGSYFSDHQIVTDICGVKHSFLEKATLLSNKACYCSHHPMAGKEKIGIENADDSIFKGANFLITPSLNTKAYAISTLTSIAKDLSFGKISIIDPQRHDDRIGFTSQLTHAIAVSLVNCDHDPETKDFIGDSYRDLTRIAKINEQLWSELFLENKDNLLSHIASFEAELDILKEALLQNDKEKINALFRNATKIRKEMEK